MDIISLNLYPKDNKRNTVISCHSLLKIDKVNAEENLSYSAFYNIYMSKNIPVVFTSVSNSWDCRRDWLNTFDNADATNNTTNSTTAAATTVTTTATTINFENIKKNIENVTVPISNCYKQSYDSHEKFNMNLYEFLDYWQQEIFTNANYPFKKNPPSNLFYLKDWHLKMSKPNYRFYDVPKYFASDWLNEYLIDNNLDDYRFVYMGPKGTWTPLHCDVFSSFSWSTNICGQKKWILIPPGEEFKLHDSFHNLPFSIDENILNEKNIQYFTVIQEENESIFVPSGWYHQVWNLTDTISINHNWFNACNIDKIWFQLSNNMQKVLNEIQDCKSMDNFTEHCQTMLRASFGMNYCDFIDILDYIEKKSLIAIFRTKRHADEFIQCKEAIKYDKYKMNSEHLYVDLRAIRHVVKIIKTDVIVRDNMEFLNRCLHLENETHLFDGIVCEK